MNDYQTDSCAISPTVFLFYAMKLGSQGSGTQHGYPLILNKVGVPYILWESIQNIFSMEYSQQWTSCGDQEFC